MNPLRCVPALVIVVLVAAGCGHGGGDHATGNQASSNQASGNQATSNGSNSANVDASSSVDSSSFADPPTERSGPETPQSPANRQPAVSLPVVPIGPPSVDFDPDHASQCLSLNFSGDGALPASTTVAKLDIAGGFQHSDACDGSGDRPLCTTGESFDNGCQIGVAWSGPGDEGAVQLVLQLPCDEVAPPFCPTSGVTLHATTPMQLIFHPGESPPAGDTTSAVASPGDSTPPGESTSDPPADQSSSENSSSGGS